MPCADARLEFSRTGRASDHGCAGKRNRRDGIGKRASHGLVSQALRYSGRCWRKASAVPEVDHGGVLAWQERSGRYRIPASKCRVDPRFGPDLIIHLVHAYPHEITLVPVGPLTNIALALQKDPSIVPLVKEVIIMGGSISGGNVNAAAEANIYNDPEAAQIVFQAGWPLTMSGLEVGDKALFTQKYLDELGKTHGPINDFIYAVNKHLISLAASFGAPGSPMYDPSAVAIAIDPTLVKTQDMHVDVETRGEFTRGETVANRHGAIERNVLHGDRYVIEGVE